MTWAGSDIKAKELPLPDADAQVAPASVSGMVPAPAMQLYLLNADGWEQFVCEWGTLFRDDAHLVARIGGANDRGVDVAIFQDDTFFDGQWECCQCKYYAEPLSVGDARVEVAKLIWHIYSGRLTTPFAYTFFAPKDCSATLRRLLLSPEEFRAEVINKWTPAFAKQIAKSAPELDADLEHFVKDFDFSIFRYKPVEALLAEHARTPYHATRFFAVDPPRSDPTPPSDQVQPHETVYLSRLTEAYADYRGCDLASFDLDLDQELKRHHHRQRIAFFTADSLKRFARDNHPDGTYEKVEQEVLDRVSDTVTFGSHPHGLARLTSALDQASGMSFPASILGRKIVENDKRGMCHHLANDMKLRWIKP